MNLDLEEHGHDLLQEEKKEADERRQMEETKLNIELKAVLRKVN